MEATHAYHGYGCVASMAELSTCPRTRHFSGEQVVLLATRHFDVIFMAEGTFWITDREAWDRDSQPLDTEG